MQQVNGHAAVHFAGFSFNYRSFAALDAGAAAEPAGFSVGRQSHLTLPNSVAEVEAYEFALAKSEWIRGHLQPREEPLQVVLRSRWRCTYTV